MYEQQGFLEQRQEEYEHASWLGKIAMKAQDLIRGRDFERFPDFHSRAALIHRREHGMMTTYLRIKTRIIEGPDAPPIATDRVIQFAHAVKQRTSKESE